MNRETRFYPPMDPTEIKARMQELEQAIAANENTRASAEDMQELHARYTELENQLKDLENANDEELDQAA